MIVAFCPSGTRHRFDSNSHSRHMNKSERIPMRAEEAIGSQLPAALSSCPESQDTDH